MPPPAGACSSWTPSRAASWTTRNLKDNLPKNTLRPVAQGEPRRLEELPDPPLINGPSRDTLCVASAFRLHERGLENWLVTPMAAAGAEAVARWARTRRSPSFRAAAASYNYFKQTCAQVTNPPVDAIAKSWYVHRTTVGPRRTCLSRRPKARDRSPSRAILTNEEWEKLRLLGDSDGPWGRAGFKSYTLPMLFDVDEGGHGLERAMEDLCRRASAAIAEGYGLIILSDRGLSRERAPIPALLAVAGVHHHLIREGTRTQVGFVVESGEPREVHHFALLLGYGAAAINPYLAFDSIHDLEQARFRRTTSRPSATTRSRSQGRRHVISNGISTIQSYCGAQIFEPGLARIHSRFSPCALAHRA